MNVAEALAQLESEQRPFTVVQLGAYIGNTPNDPLWEFFKEGSYGRLFALEPIQEYFGQLAENYQCAPGVFCLRMAIADHDGWATMYKLGVNAQDHGGEPWHNQLSSLKEERLGEMWARHEGRVNRHDLPFLLANRVTEEVPCKTFGSFCKQQGLKSIDLLVMDVEGSEVDILTSMDWEVPIRFLHFEYTMMTQDTLSFLEYMLAARGYEIEVHGDDAFCWRKE